jgi:hypothetical protein
MSTINNQETKLDVGELVKELFNTERQKNQQKWLQSQTCTVTVL